MHSIPAIIQPLSIKKEFNMNKLSAGSDEKKKDSDKKKPPKK
jgi:hypothetical protein